MRMPRYGNPIGGDYGIYPGALYEPKNLVGQYGWPDLSSNSYGILSGGYSNPVLNRVRFPTSPPREGQVDFSPFDSGSYITPPKYSQPSMPQSDLVSMPEGGKRSLGSQYAQTVQGIQSFGNPSAGFSRTMAPFSGIQQTQSVNNFLRAPSAKSAVGAGATYALNANPYYAGINMLTGGALDKGVNRFIDWGFRNLGLSKNPRTQPPDAAKVSQQLALANATSEAQNRYMKMYQESKRQEEEANQNLAAYRQQAENLGQFGLSDRQAVGRIASQLPYAATEAALASNAANASRMGISGGVPAGAEAALRAGMAQAAGATGTALTQDVLNRADAMRGQLFAADQQQRQQAAQNALTQLGLATELPFQLQAANQRQQQIDQARDEQIYQRRQLEQGQVGQILGLIAPSLISKLGKKPGDTTINPVEASQLPERGFGTNPITGRGFYIDPSGATRDFDTNEIVTDQYGRPIQQGNFDVGPDYVNPFTGEQYFIGSDGQYYSTNTGNPLNPRAAATSGPAIIDSNKPVEMRSNIMLEMSNPNSKPGDIAQNVPPQLQKYGPFVKGPDGMWRKR